MDAPPHSSRLRILFLTPQLPYPPHQGTSIRNYNLIRCIGLQHTVDLASFLAPGDVLSSDNPLQGICSQIHTVPQPARTTRDRLVDTLRSPKPDMGQRLHSGDMFALLDGLDLTDYDIVQVEGIEMAPYGLYLARTTAGWSRRPAIVFDNHNCEFLLQKRNALTDLHSPKRWLASGYSMIQWTKLRAYERQACDAADLVVAVSEPDRQALEQLTSRRDILLVPNGIETGSHSPRTPGYAVTSNIVFTGKMDYRPNIDAVLWFSDKVFPFIQAEIPGVIFQIVGQQPHQRLKALQNNPGIVITGQVPQIQPYLDSAAVFVIPMRIGGGTRLKALEAMAAGLPIVSTTLGVEGISVQDGREMLIRDKPEAFAQAVTALIADHRSDGQVSFALGVKAREFVVKNYDWSTIVPPLEEAYLEQRARHSR